MNHFRSKIKKLIKICFCFMLLVSSIVVVKADNESYILNDVFVSNNSGQENKNFANSQTLIFGKLRHAYIRFDLSKFDSKSNDQYIFKGTWNKGSRSEIIVSQSSEFLRNDKEQDSETLWTTDNMTYTNRPIDIGNLKMEQKWESGALEIDLTNFIKEEVSKGEKTACIHITTKNVEDTTKSAVEINSSRSATNQPILDVVKGEKVEYLNNIVDNAYVSSMSGCADKNYANSSTLVFGKSRHLYFRFDLSKINDQTEQIIFKGTYAKGTKKPIIVTEASQYLREDNSKDSQELWNTENITYSNRPLDIGTFKIQQEWPFSQTNLEIDLTEFLKNKKSSGEDTACIHITTTTVDNGSVGAVEINSSRSDSGKPKLDIISENTEKPVEVLRQTSSNNYYNNGKLVQKTMKIKTDDNLYLKVNEDETVTTTNNAQSATVFGLHVYQYDEYERENYGSTKTTYAFEDLATGKYLTIQNYFKDSDSDKSYYNKAGNRYIIKSSAPDVNWNERFDLSYYPESKYYSITSHLTAYRDSSNAASPLYVENNVLKSGANEDIYKFYFEEVDNVDKLNVLQKVNGNEVELTWKPVNHDTDVSHYSVDNGNVIYDAQEDVLKCKLSLSVGKHSLKVQYKQQSQTINVRIFKHMALVHSEEQLNSMKEHILNKEEPWYSDYQRLLNEVPDHMSDTTFEIKVHEGVGRGDPEGHGNMSDYEQSANAAYFNALRWVITGEDKYAQTAVNVLNQWSSALKIVDGRDRILGAAISTFRMNNAAEIIKYYNGGYKGYSDSDFEKYQNVLLNVIYPVVQDLGLPMTANGNWDTAALAAMVSIGVICENTEIYDRAIYLYQDIHTNGSIAVYVSDWGQSVESFRDQAHAQLGISYLADVCEVAEKQGQDLYSLYNNRLAKAFNWAAQYNLYNTENLKMEPLTDVFGRNRWSTIDSEKINRGELRSVYELPLAHYSKISGVDVTWMKKAAEAMRAEGYVNNDHLNFGTLTSYNGEATEKCEPYFQLRTRLEPWYQRTWNDAKKYGEIVNNVPETLTSYFDVSDNGELTASSKKENAPYYQLETLEDGTNAIRCTTTNTYLSVKDEKVNGMNVIKADAKTVGENEKFVLKGTGASFFYLQSPAYDNRIVYVDVDGNDPTQATLTMRLGEKVTDKSASVSNNERFILMYNTKDVALENIDLPDTTQLEKYINELLEKDIQEKDYTKASYQKYKEQLNEAIQCLKDAKNGKVTQEDVDDMLEKLKDSFDHLEKVPHSTLPSIDQDNQITSSSTSNKNEGTKPNNNVKTGDDIIVLPYIVLGIAALLVYRKMYKIKS